VGNFPNSDGFVLAFDFLVFCFFVLLICTWTLTFYGLKSTDLKTLCRASLLRTAGGLGAPAMERNKPWIGLANGLSFGHFYLNQDLLRLGEIIWLLYDLIQGKLSA